MIMAYLLGISFFLLMFIGAYINKRKKGSLLSALSLIEEGVLLVDKKGRVQEFNDQASRILGFHHDLKKRFPLQYLKEISPEGFLHKCETLIKRAQETKTHVKDIFIYYKEKTPHQIEIKAMSSKRGKTLLIMQETHKENHVVKMGKEFIANASHELRTPIAIIRGFVEMLQELPEVSEAMLEDIFEKILRSCKRMDDIVKNLLVLTDLDHLSKPNKKQVDMVALIDNCCHSLISSHPEASIEVQSDHSSILVGADSSLLELAVMNLLQNAVKYSSKPAHIEINIADTSDQVALKIKDHGHGISEENLLHIFDRFYAVDKAISRKLGGAGLGLSIVKTIIDKHEAEISVTSQVAAGTTFTIVFPKV